jgi:hypothetical protein
VSLNVTNSNKINLFGAFGGGKNIVEVSRFSKIMPS